MEMPVTKFRWALVLGGVFAASAAMAAPAVTATPAADSPAASAEAALPNTRKAANNAWSEDGLQKVSIKGVDVAYAQPGASLAGYQKVMLKPITVAFRRGWGRSSVGGSQVRVRPEDAQRIKLRLSALLEEEMAKELTKGGYQLSTSAGEDVLQVELAITDLFIVAPDVPSASFTRVYGVSAGEMTLVAELADSTSGEVLMRTYDNEEGDSFNRVRQLTNFENEAEARRVTGDWAQTLRKLLDAAKSGPGG